MIENSGPVFANEMIGLIAGGIVCLSTVPQITKNARDRKAAIAVSLWRQMLMVLGNLLWVVYGILAGTPAVIICCAITSSLNIFVVYQGVKARNRKCLMN